MTDREQSAGPRMVYTCNDAIWTTNLVPGDRVRVNMGTAYDGCTGEVASLANGLVVVRCGVVTLTLSPHDVARVDARPHIALVEGTPRYRERSFTRRPPAQADVSRRCGIARAARAAAMSDARGILDATLSERDWQETVIALLRAHHWLCYHTYDARRSRPGFPDIIAIRGWRILAVELKAETGRISAAQREWLDAFAATGHAESYVWRPRDWDQIARIVR